MPNTVTPPGRRSGPPPRSYSSGNGGARKWSREPHHRRRRLLAGVLVLLLVVVILIAAGSGGSPPPPVAVHTAGLLTRIQTLGGSGPTSFAGVENAAQNAAINRTLAYTPAIRVAGSQHREIALTFDDGPGPYTPQVVSVLDAAARPGDLLRGRDAAEQYFQRRNQRRSGRWLHDRRPHLSAAPMSELSPADQRSQLLSEANELVKLGARFPRLFRPPYGLWNSETLALSKQYHMLMVLWTVDTSDYRLPGTDSIIDSVRRGARPGAIMLMHDAGGTDRNDRRAAEDRRRPARPWLQAGHGAAADPRQPATRQPGHLIDRRRGWLSLGG